jgi:hypothetical protein
MSLDLIKTLGLPAAIATVLSALVTGIVSLLLKKRMDAEVERLKADLAHANKVLGARVDYEYEALKRLYSTVEPVLFAAHIAATSVSSRLLGMVDRIREGYLDPKKSKSWMKDKYYQRSTAYRLFLPMAHYRSLSRRISQLDLTLSPLLGRKFMVLAIFEDILVAHFDLARIEGHACPYDPYAEVSDKERQAHPEKYAFQGLVRGEVEWLISTMMSADGAAQAPLEWFKFDRALQDKESELSQAYAPVGELFLDFYPATRPIIWRALIAFCLLAEFYVRGRKFTLTEFDDIVRAIGWERFDVRAQSARKEGKNAQRDHFAAAATYLRQRIEREYAMLDSAKSEEQLAYA